MDLYAVADDAARRHGVDPALVRRVLTQETGGRAGLVSPKGARGPMQLMPGTARDLGVDPDDPVQNIDGGVRYLKQQLTSFGTPELALAAYNAGPGTVRKYGGVPPYAETQKYVRGSGGQGVDGFDGSDIFGMASQAAPDAPGPASAGGGDFDGSDIFKTPAAAPKPPPAPGSVRPPQMSARRPADPTIAQDAASGFMQPFKDLGDAAMSYYQRESTPKPMPRNPLEFGKRVIDDMGSSGNVLASVLGLAGAPVQAAVRPTARAINRYGPTPNTAPQLSFKDGRPTIIPGHAAHGEEAQGIVEGALNTALSGAMPAKVRAPVVPRAKPMSIDELKTADTAAWAKVDASGYRFPKAEAKATAVDIRQLLKDAGPELYPEAAKIVARVEAFAKRGEITLGQANRLRSQVGMKLMQPGSTEADVGAGIKARIDALIDTAQDPVLAEARDLHTRFKKVEAVSNARESADLRASATNSGGNINNATRQNLKALIDPTSSKRIRNLTPDEGKVLRQVVKGTPTRNALRFAGKFSLTNPVMGSIMGALAIPTGGLTAAAGALATGAKFGADAMTTSKVEELIRLMSAGGVKPGKPAATILSPLKPLTGPSRLAGAGVVAAPLARIPAAPGSSRASDRPAQPAPHRRPKQRSR